MTLVNQEERVSKQLSKLMKAIRKHYKDAGGHEYDSIEHSIYGNFHRISITDSLGGMYHEMAYLVNKSEFAVFKEAKYVEGIFDWASKTYIRPYSYVEFTI